jgi:putative oxygen-independent coproporphyrinogen III oxidase
MSETVVSFAHFNQQLKEKNNPQLFHLTTLPPLSLYVHIPWCVRKCPYCDFNSHEIRDSVPERDYLNALFADLEQELPHIWGRKVISVFIGGGTPSVLSPEIVDELITGLRSRLAIIPQAEITLEANPGTVDNVRFKGYLEAGVNRLSLGIQSFNDDFLQSLGRIHGREEAINAIEMVTLSGFKNFNIDLMFGLPAQTEKQALDDLKIALAYQPPHLSWYQLTIEPNTLFHRRPPPLLPEDDDLWTIQTIGQSYLKELGYLHYEVSAYAKPNQRCRHNVNYWQFGDYIGIGAGAHGKISNAQLGRIVRYSKQRHPQRYLATAATDLFRVEQRELTHKEVCLEFMLNALRLHDGFTKSQFMAYTGLSFDKVESALEEAITKTWLERIGDHYFPSATGRLFLNDLLALFL